MAVFKCKMCGGDLVFEQGSTVCECEYCGSKQTLPKFDDDKKATLYERADHYRRSNEYDKAISIYEQILDEDTTDAEAYWSLVLCRYGIEYVEDPQTHKRIPTVNRAQYTSVLADEDYKSALKYADIYQKTIYEDEAKAIDDIQKGILAISQKEEPFDVFICYKETDANGRRTQDSVLANDLYHQLTNEGFKVFFSRITLEDKLGTAYEPYIFAALNSAKVMVVIGTKTEYAVKLMESGNYDEAIAGFSELGDYKDSADKIDACCSAIYGEEKWNKIKNINIGDTYTFGSYEQDNNTSNGKEKIEWQVLDKQGNSILLLSRYGLDCQMYNSEYEDVTWENCTLRKWLNSTFLDGAFSEEEQKQIVDTKVIAEKNPNYDTNPGNNTTDKVFLLSINEVTKYFTEDESCKCVPTDYAKQQGAYTSDSNTSSGTAVSRWWLRSPGSSLKCGTIVYSFDLENFYGNLAVISWDCVRPALWINL